MTITSFKEKAASGMMWTSIERILVTGGQLLVTIILSRILTPQDFGLIAIIYVFIIISDVFIDSGMGSALIQQKHANKNDYSTIFVFNLLASVLLYLILYVGSPYIASFYKMEELTVLARVLGVILIINAFTIAQRASLERALNFKSLAKVNVLALLISSFFAILAAINGYGVWALVLQLILNKIVVAISINLISEEKVSFIFSKTSFLTLFGYSSKLLLASLYGQILQQINSLAIGKYYLASQLGHFTQAKKLTDASSGTLAAILHKVTFPILAALQSDVSRMIFAYKKIIKVTAFIAFPSIVLMALLAYPLVKVLLGSKWLEAASLLQWLALARVVTPISIINLNLLNAIGRSDLFLKIELLKFPVTVVPLIIALSISLEAVTIGMMVTSYVSYFINAYLPGRMFGYGPIAQFKDLIPIILATLLMSISVIFALQSISTPVYQLIISIPLALTVFIGSAYLFKIEGLIELTSLLKDILVKIKISSNY